MQDTTYKSGWGGSYSNLDEIKQMMQKFFADFSDVHWVVEDIKELNEESSVVSGCRVVEVHFTRKWQQDGQEQAKKGREWIHVNQHDKIAHVHVEGPTTS